MRLLLNRLEGGLCTLCTLLRRELVIEVSDLICRLSIESRVFVLWDPTERERSELLPEIIQDLRDFVITFLNTNRLGSDFFHLVLSVGGLVA